MASIALLSYYSGIVDRGVENFVAEVSKRLSKKHKITIFQAGSSIQNVQIRTYQLKAFAQPPKVVKGFFPKVYLDLQSLKILLFSLLALPRLLKGKYQLIIPLNGGWQTVLCKLVCLFTRSKLLISGHAGIGSDDAWNIFFHPDVFVALTQSETNWAKKLTSEIEVINIPNGVDLSKFHSKVKAKKFNLQRPIVICASALVPYKRIDLTIRAVAKAKLSLLLLGDGQQRGYIDTLGKRLLAKNYMRVVVPHDEIPQYYCAADVFTLASKTEAFGISYIEAMACNLPIVTTNDDSRAEIIGDAGILTTPQDIGTYAKDLTIATKTNYRNAPYNQALKFSWNKIAQKYNVLIDKII